MDVPIVRRRGREVTVPVVLVGGDCTPIAVLGLRAHLGAIVADEENRGGGGDTPCARLCNARACAAVLSTSLVACSLMDVHDIHGVAMNLGS